MNEDRRRFLKAAAALIAGGLLSACDHSSGGSDSSSATVQVSAGTSILDASRAGANIRTKQTSRGLEVVEVDGTQADSSASGSYDFQYYLDGRWMPAGSEGHSLSHGRYRIEWHLVDNIKPAGPQQIVHTVRTIFVDVV